MSESIHCTSFAFTSPRSLVSPAFSISSGTSRPVMAAVRWIAGPGSWDRVAAARAG
jgi:hypothetical protein